MKDPKTIERCPLCGKDYTGYPALSRVCELDICSDCGVLEAFASMKPNNLLVLWEGAKGFETEEEHQKWLAKIKQKLDNRNRHARPKS